jgi:hypothetical protein
MRAVKNLRHSFTQRRKVANAATQTKDFLVWGLCASAPLREAVQRGCLGWWKRAKSCDRLIGITPQPDRDMYGCSAHPRNYRSAASLDSRR